MLKYIGRFRLAAEVAVKAKMFDMLDDIIKVSGDSTIEDFIDELTAKVR